ncbi:ABC transporter permease [Sporomusa malonica]|uniref:Putative hemin transport system permease protein HrtB n=1 Tax=Sporomusa malonica TaxID=112901 RepID=A0A1W2BQ01_9FIRM|nr:FtsX-like permease family protein [Sporomusa malonica]SMC74804.1 putative ABC transport system permease protein [Sporomusa malonica]
MRFAVAWRNLLAKPVQNSLTVVVAAMSIAMMVTVTLLAGGIQAGLVRATEPFDLIAGAKGSPNQLVLNTVFLQDTPIGNIDYAVYGKIANNPLVAAAIPLAFGDNYKGYNIIGAGNGIFKHQAKTGQPEWLQMAEGRPFTEPFEAVIGARAAQALGLKFGDEFKSVHGSIAGGESHDRPYRVVGLLQSVNGPYDHAILVSIASIWEAHEKHEPGLAAAENTESHDDHDHEQAVTAILIKPKGYSEAMRLYQQFQREPAAQIVFPAQVIVQLFAILGQGEQALKTVAYIIVAMGLMIMVLSIYWSALSRARERAILRALGASTHDVFAIIFTEGAIISLTGVIVGSLLGHGVYALLAGAAASKTAIALTTGITSAEVYIAVGGAIVGMIAGLIPAVLTYRTDIVQNL